MSRNGEVRGRRSFSSSNDRINDQINDQRRQEEEEEEEKGACIHMRVSFHRQ